MRLFFAIVISAAALMAAPQEKKQDQKPAPVKAADGSKPMAIPAGATRSEDGDFHYTDPQGKKWIYRQTPFGVARLEEKTEAQTNTLMAEKAAGIKATEDGDKVRFERQDRSAYGSGKRRSRSWTQPKRPRCRRPAPKLRHRNRSRRSLGKSCADCSISGWS